MKMKRLWNFSTLLLAAGLMSGCAVGVEKKVYVEEPVEDLYNSAIDLMLEGKFRTSTTKFDEVERQHPYSVWSTKAQLMAAYAYYQANRYDEGIVALDRFIQLHPANKDISYAYYLKALSYYEQISDVSRDQKMTQLALTSLRELTRRYPNSKYSRDAKLKLDLTYDHLAGKEMQVGRYYHTQRQYLAAINRFKVVVEKYQTTTHVPEALHRMTEGYYALGLLGEARKTAAVLGHNYPGSKWYINSYEMIENNKVPISITAKGKKVNIETVRQEKAAWYELWKKF
ncbi:MAG: outer membrane protein assembly factor BamD [Rhodospirillales bacterium]|jgi:outer membrane protein assembly factor BamD|tara:strand:- start:447 stop:1301 length:855 start_codon:yes stop_codon:yes gene_type:complete